MDCCALCGHLSDDALWQKEVMKMKARTKAGIVAAIVLACVVAVVLWIQKKETDRPVASQTTKIRVGYQAIASNIPFYVALEKGCFTKHGLEAEAVRFETADAAMDALIRGDIATDFSVPLMVFLTREVQLPHALMTYGFQMDTPGHTHEALLVTTGSVVRLIADLKGKTIATYPGVAAKAYFEECLRKAGFNDKDIQLKPIQASLHIQALQAGQVDALFTYEPLPTLGQHEGWSRVVESALFPRYILDPMPVTVFPILRAFVEKNPQTANAIVATIGDAITYIRENPEAANRTMVKYTTLKDESIAGGVGQMLNVLAKDADLTQVQAFADWHVQKGLVTRSLRIADVVFRSGK